MHDPGFIVHVQDGLHYLYLANRGQPYGERRGPYPSAEKADEAGKAIRAVLARRSYRNHLFSTTAHFVRWGASGAANAPS